MLRTLCAKSSRSPCMLGKAQHLYKNKNKVSASSCVLNRETSRGAQHGFFYFDSLSNTHQQYFNYIYGMSYTGYLGRCLDQLKRFCVLACSFPARSPDTLNIWLLIRIFDVHGFGVWKGYRRKQNCHLNIKYASTKQAQRFAYLFFLSN